MPQYARPDGPPTAGGGHVHRAGHRLRHTRGRRQGPRPRQASPPPPPPPPGARRSRLTARRGGGSDGARGPVWRAMSWSERLAACQAAQTLRQGGERCQGEGPKCRRIRPIQAAAATAGGAGGERAGEPRAVRPWGRPLGRGTATGVETAAAERRRRRGAGSGDAGGVRIGRRVRNGGGRGGSAGHRVQRHGRQAIEFSAMVKYRKSGPPA